ncbi:MFS general substrate transporter [Cystobasidium minutum MCA 4210]|uniref:MFS general substrate transporter n=1 Tax=Cystobasidium minutum MCA 4210 TaxID=1397322 RepID=UPI0034CE1BD5|eukprot:jgi/Rhomi1/174555/fgenesh1_kg.8_\
MNNEKIENPATTTSSSSVTAQGDNISSLHDIDNDGPLNKSITESTTAGKAEDGAEVTSDRDVEQAKQAPVQDESKLLHGSKLALVFAGMLLSVFLIALDQTILAPALPVIASKFNALEQIAWIASAYFLTQTALLLLYGQALTVFDRKWTYLSAIILFEIGSLICAVATNVDILIFGRAFAGLGAAGIFVSVLSIIAEVTTLEQRPRLFGLFGAVFAVSSVIGPLLGGAFTDHVSWRWCFYVNLPIGAVTVAAIMFILGPQPAPPMAPEIEDFTRKKINRWTRGKWQPGSTSIAFKTLSLDWIGCVLMLAIITCLVLPLQWGGVQYPWSDGRVIGTFCAFAALVILFSAYEYYLAGPTKLFPYTYYRHRTQIGASGMAFFLFFSMLVGIYYLPIYYEATRGRSASKAGIDILPFMIAVTLAAGISGGVVTAFGRYKWILVFGPWFLCIGGGLFFTVDETTSSAKLIGYQIILALGIGLVFQQTIIAVQADCENPLEIPQRTGLITFVQLIGGTIGVAIANTIFTNQLAKELVKYAPDAPAIVRSSVEAIKTIDPAQQPGVIRAYAHALKYVFIIAVPSGGIASLFALIVRDVSVKGKKLEAGGA